MLLGCLAAYQSQTHFVRSGAQRSIFFSYRGLRLFLDPPFLLHDVVRHPVKRCTTISDFGLRSPSVSTAGGGVTVFNGFIYFCIQTESKKLVETVGLF